MQINQVRPFWSTGANTGLGYETALELAKKAAHVILTGRNKAKLLAARDKISTQVPQAQLDIGVFDLNSIASIKTYAEGFGKRGGRLDVLINNAGIMFPPPGLTEDGFEAQFGVNFIGHYVLTGLLFPVLKRSAHGRVVTLSSMGASQWKNRF